MAGVDTLTQRTLGGLKIEQVADRTPWFNMLVYGNSGVGKTLLCGSAQAVPEMNPVLFVDVEGGTLTLRTQYSDVEVVRVNSFKDIQRVYSELYDGKSGYKTVVLDSLTEMQKFSMYGIMEDLQARTLGSDKEFDPDIPGIREWGKNTEQIRKMVRAFRDLPLNVLFTALEMTDRDPKTGKVTVKPSLSGKLSNEVAGFVDQVFYLYIQVVDEENQRLILTSSTEKHIAKWRDAPDPIPNPIINPNMQLLHDHIYHKETT
jgi:hypothetical protein